MKRMVVLATILGAAWAAVAAADGGGPSPGLDFGNGVVAPGGKLRYIALSDGRTTLLESVVIGTGRVERMRYLKGSYGIPLVTYRGDTGGLARDGRRLVLATWPGLHATRFVVVDPRSFRIRARVRLPGRFAFDALSPDGSLMYLIQYLGSPRSANQPYAVRAFNGHTRTLYRGAIVDRREPDERMTGWPLDRTGSPSGWAYTLYQRVQKRPFVHALDTAHRRAFCIDLPWRSTPRWLARTRMRLSGGKLLLRVGHRTMATVDTDTFEVSRG